MATRIDTPPDLARPDSELALFGYWRVEPGREDEVADTISRTWGSHVMPRFGLVSYNVFLGVGGVLHHIQLARLDTRPDVEVHPSFKATIDRRMPGIDFTDITAARPYRSTERRPNPPPPGCYTRTEVTLADPSPDTQHRWVDAVLTVSPAPSKEHGSIATHYYLTTDATRVLTLTEWTTDTPDRSVPDDDPASRKVPGTPETTEISTAQYRFAFSLFPEMTGG